MDCTITTGRLLLEDNEQQTPYRDVTRMSQGDPPIYAALVREWQASGRMLPGARDAQWTILTSLSPAMTGRCQRAATVPCPGRWERVTASPLGCQAELLTTV
ncbi:hypothetical protein [Streptomyces sp. NPDC001530]|uniref:hypothetical protein n=1 Tax=Streptomyces sp. NPDC001530 TaxID=3364582 RepID=UPI00368B4650